MAIGNHCSFDFLLLFGRQQMSHSTVMLLVLAPSILQISILLLKLEDFIFC